MPSILSAEGKKQITESRVLGDLARNAVLGSWLELTLETEHITHASGTFSEFVEKGGAVYVELRLDGIMRQLINPKEITVLKINNGFYNDYRPRKNHGKPAGGNSI